MQTRSVTKTKDDFASLLAHSTEPHFIPNNYLEAMKHPRWQKAMKEEFQALIDNDTWELVPPHVNVNVIGCKWVYKVKHKVYGSIERLKARLVAQGFK
jgi:hypothetical protein